MSSHIYVQRDGPRPYEHLRTGVSLHSHTLHSRESLDFVYRALLRLPVLAGELKKHVGPVDLSRGWWTPPLGPQEVWESERAQIEGLSLHPLISLTGHDNLEAPFALRHLADSRDTPLSTEWTVPFGPTFFHLGVHNLPAAEAPVLFAQMQDYRREPDMNRLGGILRELARRPGVLTVLNHPLWDERGIGEAAHSEAVRYFLQLYRDNVHAIEINGLRPWSDNRAACSLASGCGKPVISGGDRHALETNAVLNLIDAASFDEFVDEIRSGWSHVLVLRHYREPHERRLLRNTLDILRSYERHAKGWRTWSDRAFFRCDDGQIRTFTELIGPGARGPLNALLAAVQFASGPHRLRFLGGIVSAGNEVTR